MSAPVLNAYCPNPNADLASSLVNTLIQTLITAQCAISAKDIWPKDYGEEALKSGLETYDFVIVGAGTAGSVVASRLSENPSWKVLVLEAGSDPPQESEIPALYSQTLFTNYTWNYYTEPQTNACFGARGRKCYCPRGKMIGGTGGINGMIFLRGNRRDYDSWLAMGNVGWGWDDVQRYFRKAVTPVGNRTHPIGHVVLNDFNFFYDDVLSLVCNASASLGVPHVKEVGGDGAAIGCTLAPGTVENGRRMSTGKTYLGRVSKRPNLHVIKHAEAIKINFEKSGQRATSVTFMWREKHRMTARFQRELVVSAGAIDSAKLLLLSGVGPKSHLDEMKIPVIHDLPIGNNLQDHVINSIYFKLNMRPKQRITAEDAAQNMFDYLLHSKGPFSGPSSVPIVSFVNTLPKSDVPYPTTEFHNMFYHYSDIAAVNVSSNLLALQPQYADYLRRAVNQTDLMHTFNVLADPKSTGVIRLNSSNYKNKPRILPNYLTAPEDLDNMLHGVRFLERLEHTAAYRSVNATILRIPIKECDKLKFKSDDYWRCYIKYFTTTGFHITGTVKMGPPTDVTTCVNSQLRLHGAWNVRVADASIMPHIVSVNTNAATIMIAEHAADLIKTDWAALKTKIQKQSTNMKS